MLNSIRIKKIFISIAIIFHAYSGHAATSKNLSRYECGTPDLLYSLANLIAEKNSIDRAMSFNFDAIKTIQKLSKTQNVLKCEAKLELVDRKTSAPTDSVTILYQLTIDEKSGGYIIQFEPSRN